MSPALVAGTSNCSAPDCRAAFRRVPVCTAGDSWTASQHLFSIGDKDAVHPPLVAQLDPLGSILAIVVNQAQHQPLIFIGMPGFDQTRRQSNAVAGGTETPLTFVNLHNFQGVREANRVGPVQDLAWSGDGSLLSAVTADAHICILPRLGMPLPLLANSAPSDMQKSLAEFVHPPPREPDSGSVTMPTNAKRVSLSMCPINSMYPYFALPGASPTVSELSGGGGDAAGGVSSQGSQTAESIASNNSGGAAGQQKLKMRMFTICAHANNYASFAVCDGSVTVVLSAKTLDTRDEAVTPEGKKILEQAPFSTEALVKHWSSMTLHAPRMAHWPADPLASFARAAQVSIALGHNLGPTIIKGSLDGKQGA